MEKDDLKSSYRQETWLKFDFFKRPCVKRASLVTIHLNCENRRKTTRESSLISQILCFYFPHYSRTHYWNFHPELSVNLKSERDITALPSGENSRHFILKWHLLLLLSIAKICKMVLYDSPICALFVKTYSLALLNSLD